MSENNHSEQVENERPWSRVAPIGVVYFFVKAVTVFVTRFLLYMIPAFALNLDKIKEHSAVFVSAISFLVLLFAIGALLNYLFYTFRISGERVEIKSGLFKKRNLDLPFNKIQNVKIEEPFYYRPFGYASIELESAGSAGQEAKIVAIKLENAQAFKQQILDTRAQLSSLHSGSVDTSNESKSISNEVIINTRSIGDLVIHGITNNRIWLLLGAAAPFYQGIVENLGDALLFMGFDIKAYLNYNAQSFGTFILHVFSVVMFVMLLVVSFSVLGSILIFYDYRLSKHKDQYVKRSGLFSKQEVTMKKSRIQVALQQQDWLDILIGRANLKLEQNKTGGNNANAANDLGSANKLIVPSITPLQSSEIIAEVFAFEDFDKLSFDAVSKRLIARLILFPIAPFIIAICLVAYLNQANIWVWLATLGISVCLCLLACLRWFRWGYYCDNKFVCIRKGLLGKEYIFFPKSKTQQLEFVQTPIMRRKRLASIKVVLASGVHKIPYIPLADGLNILDDSLLTIERDKPAWM